MVIGLASSALSTSGAETARSAEILHHYSLPAFSLQFLGYSAEELATAQANGLPAIDLPALGSGLQHLGGNYYVGVSDRGPTFTRATPTPGRVYPLPDYTPTIVFFQARNGEIDPNSYLPIVVDDAGTPATGIAGSLAEDAVPFATPTATVPLGFNPNGLDVEDLHMLSDGNFIVVDEYSPSIAIISDAGKVLKRYTPEGKTLPGAAYPVSDILPGILSQRRSNRGFESIAVTKDERTAYAIMQSPLGPTGSGSPTRDSRVVRILRLDISDLLDIKITGQFLLLLSPAADYLPGNAPRDLKVSAAVCLSEQKLLVLERSDETGIGGARLVLVDVSEATDVNGWPEAQTLMLENSNLDLATMGIAAASSKVIFRNEETPELTDFKLEGLSILNRNQVAISNDNDFGLEGPQHFQMWIIRLGESLP